ncbi:WD40/YVTN/BNR-like repeat-containing protein [Kutzneria albida]|uniref:Oxidoreductase n=1 Tax=Kutzneria albida DSM 43870 TaxID=1449976 RepID=W5W8A9_9PSEU|nr:YCF48-related protein [Kutzneria albida]AHH97127.1 oxidoreductase [Kutzneria albida DSM 43870]
MRWITGLTALALALAVPATALAQTAPTWTLSSTTVDARLRGLSAVNGQIAWVSGSKGTVLRTEDAGRTWLSVPPEGTAALDFRDIQAFDEHRALALSIGPGDQSRIYRTTDGGKHWATVRTNTDPAAFYDCMAFFDERHGLVVGDPVNGRIQVLATDDGGRSWQVLPAEGMPAAQPGEAQFAASGQCVSTDGDRDAWIGTGGGAHARVLHSGDRGRTWTAVDTPLASSQSAGVFSVAFRDWRHGLAIGGDYATPTATGTALALTSDTGAHWRVPAQAPHGYRSGASWARGNSVVAVGPTGSDLSRDGGRHWQQFDTGSFDTVDCQQLTVCWAAGEHGRIGRLRLA